MSNTSLWYQRPTNTSDPSGFFFDYLTQITDGLWPIGLSFMTFSVVYLSLNDYNPRKAYAAASFVSFVVVTLLVALGAFESSALIIALLAVILAVVIN